MNGHHRSGFLIKKSEEVARVEKQIAKLSKLLDRGKKQLGNPRYVENAPQSLVDEVTNQVAQWEADISNYQAHLAVLADLVDQ